MPVSYPQMKNIGASGSLRRHQPTPVAGHLPASSAFIVIEVHELLAGGMVIDDRYAGLLEGMQNRPV
jgi:hypothetical protein